MHTQDDFSERIQSVKALVLLIHMEVYSKGDYIIFLKNTSGDCQISSLQTGSASSGTSIIFIILG